MITISRDLDGRAPRPPISVIERTNQSMKRAVHAFNDQFRPAALLFEFYFRFISTYLFFFFFSFFHLCPTIARVRSDLFFPPSPPPLPILFIAFPPSVRLLHEARASARKLVTIKNRTERAMQITRGITLVLEFNSNRHEGIILPLYP